MKYSVEDIKKIIDSGEPIFVLRAQDICANDTLEGYRNEVRTAYGVMKTKEEFETFDSDLKKLIMDFREWRILNQEKLKVPD